ncbi:flagellar hook-basal body protein [Caldibacillus lycopersici]|uniref:Flagellar hook-basal body protein n=1 Tax=Perspicuibacillus lycopersici TaxID=1325689 RepID=A0AAE3ITE2_9BACI|nr:flagellar hook-basal body protein [Perspicuibacillus lycopersici]MCU9613278.1 flagellar hook-basal body protein [Perspicuibacillus lycopersici]
MLRGFYTAASGMIAQQKRTEMLTNNLANVNTPGFKADQSSVRAFPEMLLQRMENQSISPSSNASIPTSTLVGAVNTGVYVQDMTPNFKQGDLGETGVNTDIALNGFIMPTTEEGITGSIFYTIENPEEGNLYTRNGNFTLDASGYLTTPNGQYVLDAAGNRIQLASDQFTVSQNGWIEQNNQLVTRLGVAFAENPNQLTKGDNGYYSFEGELPSAYTVDGLSFTTNQGYTERSNVNSSQTMTEMLAAYRSFEANQKVLQAYDQSLDKAVNDVGKI